MRLDIRGLNLDLTDAILGHVRSRLADLLTAFGPRIGTVSVRVADVTGPRGGTDKRCWIEVTLEGSGTASVEQTDADLYAAVNGAASRMRRLLRRQVEQPRPARLARHVSAPGPPATTASRRTSSKAAATAATPTAVRLPGGASGSGANCSAEGRRPTCSSPPRRAAARTKGDRP